MSEWLLEQVLDGIKDYVEPWIHPPKDNANIWYFVSLALLLIIVYAVYKREAICEMFRKDERREHDRILYRSLKGIFSERDLRDFLSYLVSSSIYYQNIAPALIEIQEKAELVATTFLDCKINAFFKSFIRDLAELDRFVSRQFFPVNVAVYKMQPEVSEKLEFGDEEAEIRWKDLRIEPQALVDKTLVSYERYREAVKRRLKV